MELDGFVWFIILISFGSILGLLSQYVHQQQQRMAKHAPDRIPPLPYSLQGGWAAHSVTALSALCVDCFSLRLPSAQAGSPGPLTGCGA